MADIDADGIPAPADCNDRAPDVRPGLRDQPGNRIDEDCSGRDAPTRACARFLIGRSPSPSGPASRVSAPRRARRRTRGTALPRRPLQGLLHRDQTPEPPRQGHPGSRSLAAATQLRRPRCDRGPDPRAGVDRKVLQFTTRRRRVRASPPAASRRDSTPPTRAADARRRAHLDPHQEQPMFDFTEADDARPSGRLGAATSRSTRTPRRAAVGRTRPRPATERRQRRGEPHARTRPATAARDRENSRRRGNDDVTHARGRAALSDDELFEAIIAVQDELDRQPDPELADVLAANLAALEDERSSPERVNQSQPAEDAASPLIENALRASGHRSASRCGPRGPTGSALSPGRRNGSITH